MPVRHRPARPGDAAALHALRRDAILALAAAAMGPEDAAAWAHRPTQADIAARLGRLEFWVAEREGCILGWGAIDGDRLEGLYTAPAAAGTGVGGALLARLEGLIRARGFAAARLMASPNAAGFYARRGYRRTGPPDPALGLPMAKPFAP